MALAFRQLCIFLILGLVLLNFILILCVCVCDVMAAYGRNE